jgi:hypothetical protein
MHIANSGSGVPIPFVEGGTGGFNIDVTKSEEFSWGETFSTEKTWSASLPVTAPGEMVIFAKSMISKGKVDVAFTLVLKSRSAGVEATMKGTWRGVASWNLVHIIEQKNINPPSPCPFPPFCPPGNDLLNQ